ncbi:Lipoprotein Rz1 precursor [Yersinia frederiksenii]|nr:Lipoprotein Rz1 precursor [Yersinia frederiksenii]
MLNLKTIAFALLSITVLSGCSSMPHVQSQRPKLPAPPAWMMLPAPDLTTPLNGIISVSESESESQLAK